MFAEWSKYRPTWISGDLPNGITITENQYSRGARGDAYFRKMALTEGGTDNCDDHSHSLPARAECWLSTVAAEDCCLQ